jgi:hypothetical protein
VKPGKGWLLGDSACGELGPLHVSRRTIRSVVLGFALLVAGGCAMTETSPPEIPTVLLQCTPRETTHEAGSDAELVVPVHLHLMKALDIENAERDELLKAGKDPEWKLAPLPDAVTETWNDAATAKVFEQVNAIWKRKGIRVSLLRVDVCPYYAGRLRLDRRIRESMFTPESQVPWAPQLFNSINRLFTIRDPHVIHVLVWWSVSEEDTQAYTIYGYSRSAAYGGPAVWVDAAQCMNISDDRAMTRGHGYARCGVLVAHEIGHALGLQHVDDQSNLMWQDAALDATTELTPQQASHARHEARQRFGRGISADNHRWRSQKGD